MEVLNGALAAGLVMGVVDGVWLAVISRKWTQRQLGPLLRDPILWPPALAFYVLYSFGLSFFAVAPAMAAGGDWTMALGTGAVLGLVAYGTYDLTNWSTLKGWPRAMVFVDLAWGTFMSAIASAGAVAILNQF